MNAAATPPPPPRCTRRACCICVLFGEAFSCTDRADRVCGRRGAKGGTAYPIAKSPSVFVMLWSAPATSSATADLVQPLIAALCSAVNLPDGAPSAAADNAPNGPREGAPAEAVIALGVHVGARVDELLDDRVMAIVRRMHQGGVSSRPEQQA